ncbi:uncharacterized protein BDV14DRAFT_173511 [Aspergillus stella-maris]|uniref:uncharacterized protein n=1 Tax=Aspergillus stella-maris TaxID=1810926 RepID=UPI003CCE07A6
MSHCTAASCGDLDDGIYDSVDTLLPPMPPSSSQSLSLPLLAEPAHVASPSGQLCPRKSDNRPTELRGVIHKHEFQLISARLALECFYYTRFPVVVLWDAQYEYTQWMLKRMLNSEELNSLSVFTLRVNASVPLQRLLERSSQPACLVDLTKDERERLSDSFSQEMIRANRQALCDRYNNILKANDPSSATVTEQDFEVKAIKIVRNLEYFVEIFKWWTRQPGCIL